MKQLLDNFNREEFAEALRKHQKRAQMMKDREEDRAKREYEEVKAKHSPAQLVLPESFRIIGNNKNIIDKVRADIQAEAPFHLLFIGEVGCGKTYLAELIMTAVLKYFKHSIKKQKATTIKTRDYIERVYEKMKFPNVYIPDWSGHPIVMIDDLGAERNTEFAHQEISFKLEEHYDSIDSGECINSIITTNLMIQGQGDSQMNLQNFYGDRALDRILQYYIPCYFENYSFRTGKKLERVN